MYAITHNANPSPTSTFHQLSHNGSQLIIKQIVAFQRLLVPICFYFRSKNTYVKELHTYNIGMTYVIMYAIIHNSNPSPYFIAIFSQRISTD